MDFAKPARKEDDSRQRRSQSFDSGEERRRKRRKAREAEEGSGKGYEEWGHAGLREKRPENGRHQRERDDDRYRKRLRSRSPGYESSRRHEDRDPKYRNKRDHSEDRVGSYKTSRESSAHVSRKAKGPLPSQDASFKNNLDPSSALVVADEPPEKQKPNFAPTGLLAAASNTVAQADGSEIILKYHEPAEARKPPKKDVWKLFVFKGAEIVETIELGLRSCWLIGRELAVVDLPAEHPSISKQHAVIQFRYIEKRNEFGDKLGKVKPYIIDLDSANGTLLNKDPIQGSRYLELRDKDLIQFGQSTREYVLMLSP
ncbi:FHA domain-containing DDL [Hyphodiscus hymeniophilus]|uniref:FHA domain-containing DDL n=1 Tax=Hyphodiscus hymeniophilus TaxID=353542 RepID=A0A9P6SJL1_9HELO|nr:FHA domain-containing DDL [Hyphodiscus hymeniophilus]